MDSTVNVDVNPNHRLDALRSLRGRAFVLVAPLAVLAFAFLALGTAQARVQIDFDPMRPGVPTLPVASATVEPGTEPAPNTAPAAAPGMPTLKITRQSEPGTAQPGVLTALVDDTWVRRGDVVAGYRVTALRNESIDLVNVAEPTLRLTLRLNPVSVDRGEAPQAPKAVSAWTPSAQEKKP